jgi:ABC-type nitrate/sulfonate/bicarbonate transport system substrate-binding protein
VTAALAGAAAADASRTAKPVTHTTTRKLDTVVYQLGWKKLAQFGGFFVALQKGYYKAEGIDAKFLSGGPNISPTQVVQSGQAMIGDANGSDVLLAQSKGIPLQAFAAIYQKTPNALMSLPADPLATLKSLTGKTVGLPTGEVPLLSAMLTRAGVDASAVKMVPVGFDPSVLTSGQVQGYVGYGTVQGLSLKNSGAKPTIVYFGDLGNPDYGNALFATESTIAKKSGLLTRWLRATLKGWSYYVKHPAESAQLTWNLYNTETQAVLADEKSSAQAGVPLITGGLARKHGLMWIDKSAFTAVYDLYKAAGLISQPVDYSKVFTTKILLAAGAKP